MEAVQWIICGELKKKETQLEAGVVILTCNKSLQEI